MKIKDIDNPEQFQRLVHAIFVAQYGSEFQVVDDSGGDGGNDGYIKNEKTLLAIYCPEKLRTDSDYKDKINKDIKKANNLKSNRGYDIEKWFFVTPSNLREPVQKHVRDKALEFGFVGICIGDAHLMDLFLRYPHLHDQFPDLASPKILEGISKVQEGVDDIRSLLQGKDVKQQQEKATGSNFSYAFFSFIPSKRLLSIQAEILSGDRNKGLVNLEHLRLETADDKERLWAIVSTIDLEDKITNPDFILALTKQGIPLAEKLKEPSALSMLKAERAWVLNNQFIDLDMNTYYEIQMSNTTGIPLINNTRKETIETELHRLDDEAEKLFSDAYSIALENRRYRELCLILHRMASALTQKAIFYRKIPSFSGDVIKIYEKIRRFYDTAIRIAFHLNDVQLLTFTYHHYANDIRVSGDIGKAKTYATRANELAKKYGFIDIAQKSDRLIDQLNRETQ